jgi:hypothetical protein
MGKRKINDNYESDIKCESKDIIRLRKYLRKSKKINFLTLSRRFSKIGNLFYFLCDFLKSDNCLVTELDLENNNIDSKKMKYLGESLIVNKLITKLFLGYNSQIGPEGIKYLSESLKVNTSINNLKLGFTEMGNEGAKYLSEALKENNSMKKLDLSLNNIESEGMRYLIDSLNVNTSITNLNLGLNQIDSKGIKYLKETLKNNSIMRLCLNHNNFDHNGIIDLSQFLRNNTSITKLDLRKNYIYPKVLSKTIKHLEDSLMLNTSIIKLKLDDEYVKRDSAEKNKKISINKKQINNYLTRNREIRDRKQNSFIQLLSILSKL